MNISYRVSLSTILLSLFLLLLTACSPDDQSQGQTQTAQPAPAQVAVAPAPAPSPPIAELVIQGGVLLDMVTDEPNPTPLKGIVVRDGKISNIITADSGDSLPRGNRTINAGSNYVLPGLVDAHVHFRPWLPDASIWKRASLHYGITTLMDTGPCGDICQESGQEPNEWIKAYKEFMNSNPVPDGPTLYMTGRRIQDMGGAHPLGEKLSTRDEISSYMDGLVELGVDGLKVESSVPLDMRTIIMEEANARNLPVVGHSKDAYETIEAGMKFIEHMWPVTSSTLTGNCAEPLSSRRCDYLIDLEKAPALIQTMVDNTVYLNPTLYGGWGFFAESISSGAQEDAQALEFGGVFSDMPERYKEGVIAWWARGDTLEPEIKETYKESLAKVGAFLKMLSEAGGRVLVATDAGDDKLVGVSLHREMKMLADAGIEPYKVLLGATRWPAEMTYKDELIGTIEEGKQADILIIGSNPVENIINTRNIQYVVRSGTVVKTPNDCSVITPPQSFTCN